MLSGTSIIESYLTKIQKREGRKTKKTWGRGGGRGREEHSGEWKGKGGRKGTGNKLSSPGAWSQGWPETHPWQLVYKCCISFTGLYQRNDLPQTTTSLSKAPAGPGRDILLLSLLLGHITESNFGDMFWQAELENPTHSATMWHS